jgi:manganese/zinc/iron transport system substrate-binding protein
VRIYRICWTAILASVCLLCAASTGCQPRSPAQRSPGNLSDTGPAKRENGLVEPIQYPYKVVTTCGMVTDIVTQVAGEKAQVTGLLGEGVDPHLYRPTRNDVKQLMDADVVFYSGLLLEGRMADMFAKIARGGKPVFAVTEGIDESYLLEPPEFGGHFDPHVWMDVNAWSECVAFVARSLGDYDPDNGEYYQARSDRYRGELKQLDDYARRTIGTIPTSQRVLVTAHDAFGYFARAYGLEVRSVQGISTESQAAVNDINRLVDMIAQRRIKAIFVETSVSEKNIQAIVEGAGQKGWQVAIGGKLFSDAMGAPGTYEGTYVGMIDHNVTTIARALGGEAPVRGLHGKLAQ